MAPSFLTKVFGRKKDGGDDSLPSLTSHGDLLDGRFEDVSPTVSPGATEFPEFNTNQGPRGRGTDKVDSRLRSFFRSRSRPASPLRQHKKLDELPHLPPSLFSDIDQDILFTDQVIGNRRLTPVELVGLVKACSRAINHQGPETLGIMTPHWYSASPDIQRRLISLFLHSLTTRSPLSSVPSFDSEINATRSTHDIAAILRWGLRHLQLQGNSFGHKEDWYQAFFNGERKAEFPYKAFSDTLAPLIPSEHLELLKEVLEIFSDLAAHAETNSTSGSRLSKIFGLWLLNSHHIETKDDWRSFYDRWEIAGRQLEHIFFARIRDEAVEKRMPIRLVELVRRYPFYQDHASPTTDLQLLPRPRFTTRVHDALLVCVETERVSDKLQPKSKIHPLRLIAEALSANTTTNSEYTALWTKIVDASKADGTSPPLSNIFADETIRFLSLLPNTEEGSDNNKTPFSLLARSPHSPKTKRLSFSLSEFTDEIKRTNSTQSKKSVHASPLSPPPPSSTGDWSVFSASGFGSSPILTPLSSTLMMSSVDVERTAPVLISPARMVSSNSQSRHGKESTAAAPIRKSVEFSPAAAAAGGRLGEAQISSKIAGLQVVRMDEAFIDFWADALLDPVVSGEWPLFVVCKIKSTLETALTYRGGEEASGEKRNETLKWLILEQTFPVTPPQAPLAPEDRKTTEKRPSSPQSMGKKRFSFWTTGSKSNAVASFVSSSSTTKNGTSTGYSSSSSKNRKEKERERGVSEMGEVLEEYGRSRRRDKEDVVRIRIPSPKGRGRKSVDGGALNSIDAAVAGRIQDGEGVAGKEEEAVVPVEEKEKEKTELTVLAISQGEVEKGEEPVLIAQEKENIDTTIAEEEPIKEAVPASEEEVVVMVQSAAVEEQLVVAKAAGELIVDEVVLPERLQLSEETAEVLMVEDEDEGNIQDVITAPEPEEAVLEEEIQLPAEDSKSAASRVEESIQPDISEDSAQEVSVDGEGVVVLAQVLEKVQIDSLEEWETAQVEESILLIEDSKEVVVAEDDATVLQAVVPEVSARDPAVEMEESAVVEKEELPILLNGLIKVPVKEVDEEIVEEDAHVTHAASTVISEDNADGDQETTAPSRFPIKEDEDALHDATTVSELSTNPALEALATATEASPGDFATVEADAETLDRSVSHDQEKSSVIHLFDQSSQDLPCPSEKEAEEDTLPEVNTDATVDESHNIAKLPPYGIEDPQDSSAALADSVVVAAQGEEGRVSPQGNDETKEIQECIAVELDSGVVDDGARPVAGTGTGATAQDGDMSTLPAEVPIVATPAGECDPAEEIDPAQGTSIPEAPVLVDEDIIVVEKVDSTEDHPGDGSVLLQSTTVVDDGGSYQQAEEGADSVESRVDDPDVFEIEGVAIIEYIQATEGASLEEQVFEESVVVVRGSSPSLEDVKSELDPETVDMSIEVDGSARDTSPVEQEEVFIETEAQPLQDDTVVVEESKATAPIDVTIETSSSVEVVEEARPINVEQLVDDQETIFPELSLAQPGEAPIELGAEAKPETTNATPLAEDILQIHSVEEVVVVATVEDTIVEKESIAVVEEKITPSEPLIPIVQEREVEVDQEEPRIESESKSLVEELQDAVENETPASGSIEVEAVAITDDAEEKLQAEDAQTEAKDVGPIVRRLSPPLKTPGEAEASAQDTPVVQEREMHVEPEVQLLQEAITIEDLVTIHALAIVTAEAEEHDGEQGVEKPESICQEKSPAIPTEEPSIETVESQIPSILEIEFTSPSAQQETLEVATDDVIVEESVLTIEDPEEPVLDAEDTIGPIDNAEVGIEEVVVAEAVTRKIEVEQDVTAETESETLPILDDVRIEEPTAAVDDMVVLAEAETEIEAGATLGVAEPIVPDHEEVEGPVAAETFDDTAASVQEVIPWEFSAPPVRLETESSPNDDNAIVETAPANEIGSSKTIVPEQGEVREKAVDRSVETEHGTQKTIVQNASPIQQASQAIEAQVELTPTDINVEEDVVAEPALECQLGSEEGVDPIEEEDVQGTEDSLRNASPVEESTLIQNAPTWEDGASLVGKIAGDLESNDNRQDSSIRSADVNEETTEVVQVEGQDDVKGLVGPTGQEAPPQSIVDAAAVEADVEMNEIEELKVEGEEWKEVVAVDGGDVEEVDQGFVQEAEEIKDEEAKGDVGLETEVEATGHVEMEEEACLPTSEELAPKNAGSGVQDEGKQEVGDVEDAVPVETSEPSVREESPTQADGVEKEDEGVVEESVLGEVGEEVDQGHGIIELINLSPDSDVEEHDAGDAEHAGVRDSDSEELEDPGKVQFQVISEKVVLVQDGQRDVGVPFSLEDERSSLEAVDVEDRSQSGKSQRPRPPIEANAHESPLAAEETKYPKETPIQGEDPVSATEWTSTPHPAFMDSLEEAAGDSFDIVDQGESIVIEEEVDHSVPEADQVIPENEILTEDRLGEFEVVVGQEREVEDTSEEPIDGEVLGEVVIAEEIEVVQLKDTSKVAKKMLSGDEVTEEHEEEGESVSAQREEADEKVAKQSDLVKEEGVDGTFYEDEKVAPTEVGSRVAPPTEVQEIPAEIEKKKEPDRKGRDQTETREKESSASFEGDGGKGEEGNVLVLEEKAEVIEVEPIPVDEEFIALTMLELEGEKESEVVLTDQPTPMSQTEEVGEGDVRRGDQDIVVAEAEILEVLLPEADMVEHEADVEATAVGDKIQDEDEEMQAIIAEQEEEDIVEAVVVETEESAVSNLALTENDGGEGRKDRQGGTASDGQCITQPEVAVVEETPVVDSEEKAEDALVSEKHPEVEADLVDSLQEAILDVPPEEPDTGEDSQSNISEVAVPADLEDVSLGDEQKGTETAETVTTHREHIPEAVPPTGPVVEAAVSPQDDCTDLFVNAESKEGERDVFESTLPETTPTEPPNTESSEPEVETSPDVSAREGHSHTIKEVFGESLSVAEGVTVESGQPIKEDEFAEIFDDIQAVGDVVNIESEDMSLPQGPAAVDGAIALSASEDQDSAVVAPLSEVKETFESEEEQMASVDPLDAAASQPESVAESLDVGTPAEPATDSTANQVVDMRVAPVVVGNDNPSDDADDVSETPLAVVEGSQDSDPFKNAIIPVEKEKRAPGLSLSLAETFTEAQDLPLAIEQASEAGLTPSVEALVHAVQTALIATVFALEQPLPQPEENKGEAEPVVDSGASSILDGNGHHPAEDASSDTKLQDLTPVPVEDGTAPLECKEEHGTLVETDTRHDSSARPSALAEIENGGAA